MKLSINGQRRTVPDRLKEQRLVDTLREHLGLVGAKASCGIGLCGTCTVHVDGQPTRSCMLRTGEVEEADVLTIEGLLGAEGKLHPVQESWIEERVPQCGYCQAGQIMQAVALLAENPQPSEQAIRSAMADHLCRCGTYDRIKRAIRRAGTAMSSAAHTPNGSQKPRA